MFDEIDKGTGTPKKIKEKMKKRKKMKEKKKKKVMKIVWINIYR
jgi:hypothetical protein